MQTQEEKEVNEASGHMARRPCPAPQPHPTILGLLQHLSGVQGLAVMNLRRRHARALKLNLQKFTTANPSDDLALRLRHAFPPRPQRRSLLLRLHPVDVVRNKISPKLHLEVGNLSQPATGAHQSIKLPRRLITKPPMVRITSQLPKAPHKPPKTY